MLYWIPYRCTECKGKLQFYEKQYKMQQNQGQKGSLHIIPNQHAQDYPAVFGRAAPFSVYSPNSCLHAGVVFKCDGDFH